MKRDAETDADQRDDATLIAPPDQDGEDTPPEEPPEGGGEPDKKAAEEDPRDKQIKELRRQLRGKDKRIREVEDSERTWAERARGRAEKAEDREPAKPAEEEPDLDVIEALTNEGAKGLDKVLKKLGYARVEEIDAKIERTRAHMTRDAHLIARYPDLAKEDSPFFEAAAKRYEQLAQNKGVKESGMLMELAAELAEGDLGVRRKAASGDRRREREPDPDDDDLDRDEGDDDQEPEDKRVERVRAQAGSRGRGATRERVDDDELTPLQKRLAQRFGISEDAYRKRAKSGVQMSGLPRR